VLLSGVEAPLFLSNGNEITVVMLRALYQFLIAPKAKDEDIRRKEAILNILLVGFLVLALFALCIIIIDYLQLGSTSRAHISSVAIGIIFLLSLLNLSRKGFTHFVSLVFVGIFFAVATWAVYTWGASLPQALLLYAVVVVMSGILINSIVAFVVTFVTTALLVFLTYLHGKGVLQPALYWQAEHAEMPDAIIFGVTFFLLFVISWLFNREIRYALQRARRSERELRDERDQLEITVAKRTSELKEAQLEKTRQLYRLAECGRIAAGLFHDLGNSLQVVKLHLEKLDTNVGQKGRRDIGKAMDSVGTIKRLADNARQQIQQQRVVMLFDVRQQVRSAQEILKHKAQVGGVVLRLTKGVQMMLYGDPVGFYRVILGLISNAIDSYVGVKRAKKEVRITITIVEKDVVIKIQDWGSGIQKSDQRHIFQAFFTTKDIQSGTGIGLYICKEIVEKGFAGKIGFESVPGKGTIFSVSIPLTNYAQRERRVAKNDQPNKQ